MEATLPDISVLACRDLGGRTEKVEGSFKDTVSV
jgi:hypothetical protein